MDAAIVAHGDLDGMTAAAVLVEFLRQNKGVEKYHIAFSQPFNLHESLRRIRALKPRMLFIVDVALNDEHWEHIKPELREIGSTAKIFWIDHHRSTIRRSIELLEMGIPLLASIDKCAATIAGQAFLHKIDKREFFEKLVTIGEVSDKVRSLPENHPLSHIVEVLGNAISQDPTDDDFKRQIIRTWLQENRLITDEAARRAEEAVERLRQLLKEASENIIYDSDRLRVIDLRNTRVHGYAGKIASYNAGSSKKIAIVLFRVGEANTIITARVPEMMDVDVAEILKRVAEKCGGGGGGHPKAASARIPSTLVEKCIREIIEEIEKASR